MAEAKINLQLKCKRVLFKHLSKWKRIVEIKWMLMWTAIKSEIAKTVYSSIIRVVKLNCGRNNTCNRRKKIVFTQFKYDHIYSIYLLCGENWKYIALCKGTA